MLSQPRRQYYGLASNAYARRMGGIMLILHMKQGSSGSAIAEGV